MLDIQSTLSSVVESGCGGRGGCALLSIEQILLRDGGVNSWLTNNVVWTLPALISYAVRKRLQDYLQENSNGETIYTTLGWVFGVDGKCNR